MKLAITGIPDDPIFFSDDDIALIVIRDIRLVVIAAVPLGVFRFVVLALGPHQHFDDLGAGDRLVGLEAVRIIGGINDACADEGLNVLFRPMPVDVGEGGRVLHRASRVQLQLLRQIRGKFPAGDDVVFPDEALRVQAVSRIDAAAHQKDQQESQKQDAFLFAFQVHTLFHSSLSFSVLNMTKAGISAADPGLTSRYGS